MNANYTSIRFGKCCSDRNSTFFASLDNLPTSQAQLLYSPRFVYRSTTHDVVCRSLFGRLGTVHKHTTTREIFGKPDPSYSSSSFYKLCLRQRLIESVSSKQD